MATVVGLFESREQARKAVEALKAAGIRSEDVSIVMRDREDAAEVAAGSGAKAGPAIEAGAVGGGILGALAGFLVGAGALAIPGVGPIVAAGPIMAALGGAGLGALGGGFLGALAEYGVPSEEAEAYVEALQRGAVLLTVHVPDGREAEVRRILEGAGMEDLTHHRSRWESDPNFRYDTERTTDMSTRKADKDKTQVDAKAGGTAAGGVTGAVIGGAVGGPVGAGVGAVAGAAAGGLAGNALDYNEAEPEFRSHWESSKHKKTQSWEDAAPAYRLGYESYDRPEYRGKGWDEVGPQLRQSWSGKGKYEDYEPMVRTAWERRAQARVDAGGEAVVPVVEEEVQVGKRKVEKGAVKVETRVTETPVAEQVHLHEEKVKVERRPVDRPATGADVAFQEGTIELRETAEEAVVAKTARVVEEVVVGKESRDKTQTVSETVRRTDVDVRQVDTPERVVGQDFDAYDADFRSHHQAHFGKGGRTYEQYAPAYRFGYTLAGDDRYRGDWATVEPEARRQWEGSHKGTWEEFKDAVRHAWERVVGRR